MRSTVLKGIPRRLFIRDKGKILTTRVEKTKQHPDQLLKINISKEGPQVPPDATPWAGHRHVYLCSVLARSAFPESNREEIVDKNVLLEKMGFYSL